MKTYMSRENVARGKFVYNFVGLRDVHDVWGKISVMSSEAQCSSVYNFLGLTEVHNELCWESVRPPLICALAEATKLSKLCVQNSLNPSRD